MSSISRFKRFRYPALAAVILIFVTLEIAVRVLPVRYAMGAGVFLTEHRRLLAEASEPEFDYIILGDSKSLSLKGHAPTAGEPYAIYNFSMPALDTRYFVHFVDKYLKNRKHPPSAVIYAGDPGLFQTSWNRPNHDPDMAYSDDVNESVANYAYKRFVRRIGYATGGLKKPSGQLSPEMKNMLWDAYSHRYLNLFSITELFGQFTGAERVFILKEALPLLYHTYRYREAIRYYTFDFSPSKFAFVPIPESCSGCGSVLREECHPRVPVVQGNAILEQTLRESYGQVNLADRLNAFERIAYMAIRDDQIVKQSAIFENESPDLRPMEELISSVTSRGIRFVVTAVPSIDAYEKTRHHRLYFQRLQELVAKYPLAKFVPFPAPYYPKELFVEQVHYECSGAERLNGDFYRGVVPRILEFAPPAVDHRARGFE
jgi:hypothetical protein